MDAHAVGASWQEGHVTGQLGKTTPLIQTPQSSESPISSARSSPAPGLLVPGPLSRRRSQSNISAIPEAPALNKSDQDYIERQLLRAIVSAGWSFVAVENPEVIELFKRLNPGFKLPTRNRLAGALLSAEYESVQGGLKELMTGAYATSQCDGWQDASHNHLVTFMVSANGTVCK